MQHAECASAPEGKEITCGWVGPAGMQERIKGLARGRQDQMARETGGREAGKGGLSYCEEMQGVACVLGSSEVATFVGTEWGV